MPRGPRVVLPNFAHHVVSQGHNKSPLFVEEKDYLFYLESLRHWKTRLNCRIYFFCLMTNHVHQLVDPGVDAGNLARLMKHVCGQYTAYVNQRENRTGTAWNGRYKSSIVDTDGYFMAAGRYIELNPVRAAIVANPGDYRWSSHGHWAGSATWTWLDEHALYTGLGNTAVDRQATYRTWFEAPVPEPERRLIRNASLHGHPIGDARFKKQIEERLGRRLELRDRGRPRKPR